MICPKYQKDLLNEPLRHQMVMVLIPRLNLPRNVNKTYQFLLSFTRLICFNDSKIFRNISQIVVGKNQENFFITPDL